MDDKVAKIHEIQEKQAQYARAKMGDWQQKGAALFESEFMKQRWNNWVEMIATNEFQRGMLIEETLQVLTMIRNGATAEQVADFVDKTPGSLTIIDEYLPQFIGADMPYEVRQIVDERRKGKGLS